MTKNHILTWLGQGTNQRNKAAVHSATLKNKTLTGVPSRQTNEMPGKQYKFIGQ